MLALIAGAPAAAAPVSFSLPFRAGNDPFVLVDAVVNGIGPVRTLLDTGDATPYAVLLTPALSARAGARPTGATRTSRAEIGPIPARFRSVALRSFALGTIRLARPSAADSPAVARSSGSGARRFEAVIGGEFLRNHRISIDYPRARVTFDGAAPSTPPVSFVLASRRPAAVVRVKINGAGPFAFVLDTGAAITIVSTNVARRAGLPLERAARLQGGGGSTAGRRSTARELALGAVRRRNARVIVADVLGPASAEVGMRLDGILGAPFFARGRLTIDYPRRSAWIE